MTDLGTLGAGNSSASAINEQGQIVGQSETGDGSPHAFLWKDGEMTDLGALPRYDTSSAHDINADGSVVGVSIDKIGAKHAFLWEDGELTDLGTLGGKSSEAMAINDSGQIAGMAMTPDNVVHAAVWDGDTVTELDAPDDPASTATGLNGDGTVVGWATNDRRSYVPVVWADGESSDLSRIAGSNGNALTQADAINDDGMIVGGTGGVGTDRASCSRRRRSPPLAPARQKARAASDSSSGVNPPGCPGAE